MDSFKKLIVFDLDTKKLQIEYPNKTSWRNAYQDIRKFMFENKFDHQQGSAYISNKPINNWQLNILVNMLGEKFPWLLNSTHDIRVANVQEEYYNLKPIISKAVKRIKKTKQNTKARKPSQMLKRDKKINNDHTLTR